MFKGVLTKNFRQVDSFLRGKIAIGIQRMTQSIAHPSVIEKAECSMGTKK
jgi:hypothetical protein